MPGTSPPPEDPSNSEGASEASEASEASFGEYPRPAYVAVRDLPNGRSMIFLAFESAEDVAEWALNHLRFRQIDVLDELEADLKGLAESAIEIRAGRILAEFSDPTVFAKDGGHLPRIYDFEEEVIGGDTHEDWDQETARKLISRELSFSFYHSKNSTAVVAE